MDSDVLSQLNSTRSLFASYLRIRSLTTGGAAASSSSSSTSPELKSARSDLETALVSLADDLDDLVESVEAVETNPAAYGLTAEELTRRKRLIQDVGGEVEDMRDELNKKMDEAAAKAAAASGKGGRGGSSELPDPSSFALGDDDDAGGGDNYAQFEQQQQVEMMREQDQHLDGVFRTVGTLRRQADDMGRELEEQTEMLEVLDTDADRVGRRLQTGMQKLGYIVRRNEDRWSSCFIAVLIFVLILLLVLLVII